VTSHGAATPALAGAATLFASTLGFNVNTDSSVKMNPLLSFNNGRKPASSGIGGTNLANS